VYFIHRSFSWVNVLLFLWWFRKVRASGLALPEVRWIGGLFLLQLLAGITLAYGNMPEEMQPVHLLSALLLFGAYWSAFLRLRTIAAAA
jgi:heme A synthase